MVWPIVVISDLSQATVSQRQNTLTCCNFDFAVLPLACVRFIALADAIEAAFPNVIVEGNPEGPGRPGSFEVKGQAGQLLFSRLSSGGWPEADTLVESLAAAAACDATSSVTAGQQP